MPIAHVVQQGENVTSLSARYGFSAERIWNDAANDALRERRCDMDALLPGDILTIPDKAAKSVRAATGKRHVFRRKGVPAKYRLQIIVDDHAAAARPYRLTIDKATPLEGTTDDDGVVEQFVPPGARAGELVVDLGEDEKLTLDIRFGHLDPIEELSGIEKRLANLGFPARSDQPAEERLAAAVSAFQRAYGLEVSGAVDDATRAKLKELHDTRALGEPAE